MPVTFNTNNNYNVEIITETDVINPTVIKYSSINNTPYVELKITADTYQYPLLAGNMNFDNLNRFIVHNATNNVNNTCVPPLTPHGVKSTNSYNFTPIAGQTTNGTMCSLAQVTTSIRDSYQGPYQTDRPNAGIHNDKIADGVAWTKVIWVEVYEDDNGQMVNTDFSPEFSENLATWQLWDPNNSAKPITNNIYPQYIRAFVFLEFASGGPSGLTSNVDIYIDIDEDEPIYGCTDPNADNTTPGATIDDGSCTYPPSYQINLQFNVSSTNPGITVGPYTDDSTYTQQIQTNFITLNINYTTVDYSDVAPATGNLVFLGGVTQETVTLSGNYVAGDTVSQIVDVYVYPTSAPSLQGLRVYDFPSVGGPNATGNLISPSDPNYAAEIQRMYYGWGNTKNNLTAASLRVQEIYPLVNGSSAGTNDWHNPTYQDPSLITGPIPQNMYSSWHVGDDPTGLRPTQQVDFGVFHYTGTNSMFAQEEYNQVPSNPARNYFPYRIKISIPLDFIAPHIPGTIGPSGPVNSNSFFNTNNSIFTIPINLAHTTENQGDLNWS